MVRLLALTTVMAIASMVNTMSLGNSERSRKSGAIVFPQEPRMVTTMAESPALFLLHLLKHKLKYQKIEKIPTTPPTADCICVPYYLCNANNTIITDGSGSIDIRFRRCTGDLEVCCYPPSPTPSSMPTMAPIVTPTMAPTTTTTTAKPTPMTTPTTTTTTTTMAPTTTTTTMAPTTTTTMAPTTRTTTTTTMAPTTTTVTYPPIIFPTAETTQPTTMTPAIPTITIPLNCICVPSYQCSASGVVITSGEGIINPRQQIYLCPGTDQVCCRLNAIEYPTNPVIVNPVNPSLPSGQTCLICGNILPCNGVIVVPDSGVINPRVPSGRQVDDQTSTCSSATALESSTPATTATTLDGTLSSSVSTVGSLKLADTPNACYCVKTWVCAAGNDVSPDGAGIIDPRFSLCPSADEVCCKPEGIGEDRVGRILPAKDEPQVYIVNDPKPSPQVLCGVPDTTFAPRNPYPADTGKTYFAEFPWMVALFIKQPSSYLFICGASMINSKAVLTAAHCVDSRQDGGLIARFGQWDIKNNDEVVPFQEAIVQTILIHPQYYKAALYHDIAILILASSVTYDINVKPICLPQQGTTFPAGKTCYATGWGRNAFEGQFQEELHKVDLPIVDRSDCQSRLRGTRLGPYFQLHGSFICAGGETSRDTCRGDGGGPLVCKDSTGPFMQVGIVSWGIGCGESNTPAVYASVAQHRQWIDQQLANYGVF